MMVGSTFSASSSVGTVARVVTSSKAIEAKLVGFHMLFLLIDGPGLE